MVYSDNVMLLSHTEGKKLFFFLWFLFQDSLVRIICPGWL
jgi:hypothetical protein